MRQSTWSFAGIWSTSMSGENEWTDKETAEMEEQDDA